MVRGGILHFLRDQKRRHRVVILLSQPVGPAQLKMEAGISRLLLHCQGALLDRLGGNNVRVIDAVALVTGIARMTCQRVAWVQWIFTRSLRLRFRGGRLGRSCRAEGCCQRDRSKAPKGRNLSPMDHASLPPALDGDLRPTAVGRKPSRGARMALVVRRSIRRCENLCAARGLCRRGRGSDSSARPCSRCARPGIYNTDIGGGTRAARPRIIFCRSGNFLFPRSRPQRSTPAEFSKLTKDKRVVP